MLSIAFNGFPLETEIEIDGKRVFDCIAVEVNITARGSEAVLRFNRFNLKYSVDAKGKETPA